MKKLIMFSLVFVLLFSGCLTQESVYEKYYAGGIRHFRGNLIEAEKINVHPNESSIKDVLLGPEVYKIYIAYFPNDTENAYYLASSFELTNKLGIIFRHKFQGNESLDVVEEKDGSQCLMFYSIRKSKCFKPFPINSTDDISPTKVEPVILLLGPSHANKTAVTVENNLIIAEGKDFSKVNRNYVDLDLAVDKILLVLMEES